MKPLTLTIILLSLTTYAYAGIDFSFKGKRKEEIPGYSQWKYEKVSDYAVGKLSEQLYLEYKRKYWKLLIGKERRVGSVMRCSSVPVKKEK